MKDFIPGIMYPPETNSLPLQNQATPERTFILPLIFRGYVSFSEGTSLSDSSKSCDEISACFNDINPVLKKTAQQIGISSTQVAKKIQPNWKRKMDIGNIFVFSRNLMNHQTTVTTKDIPKTTLTKKNNSIFQGPFYLRSSHDVC